jgi:mono/diheme cytochrome c family protein
VKRLAITAASLTIAGALLLLASAPCMAEDLAAAKDKFNSLCVKCHGASAKGDGPAAVTLVTKPGDLTDCTKMHGVTDDMLFEIIKEGGPVAGLDQAMQGFSEGLSDDDIKGLVSYIRSFCDHPNPVVADHRPSPSK